MNNRLEGAFVSEAAWLVEFYKLVRRDGWHGRRCKILRIACDYEINPISKRRIGNKRVFVIFHFAKVRTLNIGGRVVDDLEFV